MKGSQKMGDGDGAAAEVQASLRSRTESRASTGAELARLAAISEGEPPDFAALHAELSAQIAAEQGFCAYLRSRSTLQRAGLILAVALIGSSLALTLWGRPDAHVYPLVRMLVVLFGISALFVANAALSLWPLQRPELPGWLQAAVVAAVPGTLLALYSLPSAHSAHPASLQAPGVWALAARGWPCLLIGLAVAIGAYLLLRALDRGATRRSFVMAAGGGLFANLILQLHCPVTAPAHLLLGHLGVVLSALGLVALLERRARA